MGEPSTMRCPELGSLVGPDWGMDLVGTAQRLFDLDVRGLVRIGDGAVLAFRNGDVRRLASTTDAGNATVDALLGAAVDPVDGDEERPGSGFRPIIENQVFTFNPPQHAPFRRILTRQMTAGNVHRFTDLVDELLDALIADLRTAGTVDLGTDFAAPRSCRFWGRLLGLDEAETIEMQRLMEVLAAVFLADATPQQRHELDQGVLDYMDLVQRGVERSMATGDADPLGVELLTAMAGDLAGIDLPGLPTDVGLLAAGNLFDGFHTLGVGVANAAFHLLTRPAERDLVRADPALAGAAYDEGNRLSPPLTLTYRLALADIEHDGVAIPAGTKIGMHWTAANLDPDAFDEPRSYRLDRPAKHVIRHLTTFGGGAHLCPGRNISRYIGERAVVALTRPDLDITVAATDASWIDHASVAQLRTFPATVG